MLTSEISKKVGSLLHSREKFLRLSALRFFKCCLASNNQFTNRHFIKIELLHHSWPARGRRRPQQLGGFSLSRLLRAHETREHENLDRALHGSTRRENASTRRLAPHLLLFQLLVSQWERNQEPLPQQEATESARRSSDTEDKSGSRPMLVGVSWHRSRGSRRRKLLPREDAKEASGASGSAIVLFPTTTMRTRTMASNWWRRGEQGLGRGILIAFVSNTAAREATQERGRR